MGAVLADFDFVVVVVVSVAVALDELAVAVAALVVAAVVGVFHAAVVLAAYTGTLKALADKYLKKFLHFLCCYTPQYSNHHHLLLRFRRECCLNSLSQFPYPLFNFVFTGSEFTGPFL